MVSDKKSVLILIFVFSYVSCFFHFGSSKTFSLSLFSSVRIRYSQMQYYGNLFCLGFLRICSFVTFFEIILQFLELPFWSCAIFFSLFGYVKSTDELIKSILPFQFLYILFSSVNLLHQIKNKNQDYRWNSDWQSNNRE